MRVGKLKNGKATGKCEITGEMVNGAGDWTVDWIWSYGILPLRLVMCLETGDLL